MTGGARTTTQPGGASRRADTHYPASRRADTHCPYCALQCGMTLRETGGRVEVTPRQFPTNRGGLCQKGWTAAELLDHPDRLTTPLLRDRRGGPLRPATWDEALDRVAGGITRIRETHGRD
ncbi:MAG TPA: molybdopterin-dependent oxidoreductase, partial [Micromonospora sp.]